MKSLQIRGLEIGAGIPKICVPIVGRTSGQILAQARSAADSCAQIAEWRADFAESSVMENPGEILQQLRGILRDKLLLATFRSKAEGGQRPISPEAYFAFCRAAAESGQVDLLDVELTAGEAMCRQLIDMAGAAGVCTVISRHFFDKTPEDEELRAIFRQMGQSRASIPKLAVMPQNGGDVLRFMRAGQAFSEESQQPVILISMGQLGLISRLSGELTGSCITFGTAGQASAPGQIDAGTLEQILRVMHGE